MAIGAVAISFAAIFFRLAAPVDPLLASALRLGLSALLLLPFARRSTSAAEKRAAWICGALYAVHFGTWVASLDLTTVAASVTLVTCTPLLLAGLGWLRGKDRPTMRHVLGAVIALIGAVVIGGSDLFGGRLIGDALALIGALAMAGYLAVARELGPELDSFALSARAALVAALVLGAMLLVRQPIAPVPLPSLPSLGWIALSALVPQVLGHTALTYALKRATPTEVGLATALEPVLATVLAWLWLAETPAALVLAGCAVTLTGVLVGVWHQADSAEKRREFSRMLQ
jgi:drug/metabolite transporter (DMT)-like permease